MANLISIYKNDSDKAINLFKNNGFKIKELLPGKYGMVTIDGELLTGLRYAIESICLDNDISSDDILKMFRNFVNNKDISMSLYRDNYIFNSYDDYIKGMAYIYRKIFSILK